MTHDSTKPQAKEAIVPLRVTDETKRRLQAVAALKGSTVSDLVREHGVDRVLEMYDAAIRAADPKTPA